MVGAAIQRFAILLALIGGVLHLSGVIQNDLWGAPPGYGMGIVWLSIIVGIIGTVIEVHAAVASE